jgi:hypothetical protein
MVNTNWQIYKTLPYITFLDIKSADSMLTMPSAKATPEKRKRSNQNFWRVKSVTF